MVSDKKYTEEEIFMVIDKVDYGIYSELKRIELKQKIKELK